MSAHAGLVRCRSGRFVAIGEGEHGSTGQVRPRAAGMLCEDA